MNVGDLYRSKWNKYTAKIVSINPSTIVLENKQGVKESVAVNNFELNWQPCDINACASIIKEAFTSHRITIDDSIVIDNWQIVFRIIDDELSVNFSDAIKNKLDLSSNTLSFKLCDAEEVIYMIADLISEV